MRIRCHKFVKDQDASIKTIYPKLGAKTNALGISAEMICN
jgi:hypothetical protein